MAAWPASLPQRPNGAQGWSEDAPELAIRTQMDVGPDKVRRRTTAGVRTFAMPFALSAAQTETLDSFFLTTTAGGALAFDWLHPRTRVAAQFRFTERPTYQYAGGDYYEAEIRVEITP